MCSFLKAEESLSISNGEMCLENVPNICNSASVENDLLRALLSAVFTQQTTRRTERSSIHPLKTRVIV